MKSIIANHRLCRLICGILFLFVGSLSIYYFASPSAAQEDQDGNVLSAQNKNPKDGEAILNESPELEAFRASVGGKITPVIVELKDEPGAVLQHRGALVKGGDVFQQLSRYAVELSGKQDMLMNNLNQRGIRILLRTVDAVQVDGSVRHIEHRFTYLLNGFVAYVAAGDLEALRQQPEVLAVN